jgi:hypothetical protein
MLPGADVPTASAVDLHARASANFEAKLHETVVTLLKAAATGPVTQASSLGAEDMVITHLINSTRCLSPFVLDTGALHAETLVSTSCRAAGHAPRAADRVPAGAGIGSSSPAKAAMPCTRATCAGLLRRAQIRWRVPCTAAGGWRSSPRAPMPLIDRAEEESKRLKYNPGRLDSATCGTTSANQVPTTSCTTSSIPASVASPAPARFRWARTSAQGAGGGRTKRPRNVVCTSNKNP